MLRGAFYLIEPAGWRRMQTAESRIAELVEDEGYNEERERRHDQPTSVEARLARKTEEQEQSGGE